METETVEVIYRSTVRGEEDAATGREAVYYGWTFRYPRESYKDKDFLFKALDEEKATIQRWIAEKQEAGEKAGAVWERTESFDAETREIIGMWRVALVDPSAAMPEEPKERLKVRTLKAWMEGITGTMPEDAPMLVIVESEHSGGLLLNKQANDADEGIVANIAIDAAHRALRVFDQPTVILMGSGENIAVVPNKSIQDMGKVAGTRFLQGMFKKLAKVMRQPSVEMH